MADLEGKLKNSKTMKDISFAERIAGYVARYGFRDDTVSFNMDSHDTLYPSYSRNERKPGAKYTFSTSLPAGHKDVMMSLETTCNILNGVPGEYKLEVTRESNEMSTSPYWDGYAYKKVLVYSKKKDEESLAIDKGDWRKLLEEKLPKD